MNEEFTSWDIKLAEFRGSTITALENIHHELKGIKKDIKDIKTQNMRSDIKTAGIAGSVSVIVVILGLIISAVL